MSAELPADDVNAGENELLHSAAAGNESGWLELQRQYRGRLHRLVSARLDARMRARVDASDVVQDAFIEAWQKLPGYIDEPRMPFYLWLRSIAGHKLMALHRFHLGTSMRAAGKEVSIYKGAMPETTSAGLAAHLAGELTHASEAAMNAELADKLQAALDQLDPLDREVLTLRHFEQLTNSEVATVLDLEVSAASKRYIRALRKVRQLVPSEQSGTD